MTKGKTIKAKKKKAKKKIVGDVVYTPVPLAKFLIEYLNPTGRVLDPCRGNGAFYDNFPAGCEKLYCEITEGKDFFDFHEPVDWIITNPPYSTPVLRAFLTHSFRISNNVAFLINETALGLRLTVKLILESGFGERGRLRVHRPKLPGWTNGSSLSLIWWERGYNDKIPLPQYEEVWLWEVGVKFKSEHYDIIDVHATSPRAAIIAAINRLAPDDIEELDEITFDTKKFPVTIDDCN
ncbi:hypothetical protein [Magnetovibrio blakemorei]|nr:hypothetical protein [Magnetovibrio blakemorei]